MCFAGAQQAMDITSGPVSGGRDRLAGGFALIANRQQAARGGQAAQQRLAPFRTNFAAANPGNAARRARVAGTTGTSGGMTGAAGGY